MLIQVAAPRYAWIGGGAIMTGGLFLRRQHQRDGLRLLAAS